MLMEWRKILTRENNLVYFFRQVKGCAQITKEILRGSTSFFQSMGHPIDGFRLQDCPAIFGDGLEVPVHWMGSGELERLQGQPVRLRFELKDADLYAFRFQ